MSTEPLNVDVEDQNEQLLDMLEGHVGGDLTEDERKYLLSSDEIKMQIKREQIGEQRLRLDELTKIMDLIKQLNTNVHDQDAHMAEISKKLEVTCKELIPAANADLASALKNKRAMLRKKQMMAVLLVVIIALVLVYFFVIK